MGYKKIEIFFPKNQHTQTKILNFEKYLAKIRFLKVDCFVLPLFLVPKKRLVAQNEWNKHPYIFFLLLVQK